LCLLGFAIASSSIAAFSVAARGGRSGSRRFCRPGPDIVPKQNRVYQRMIAVLQRGALQLRLKSANREAVRHRSPGSAAGRRATLGNGSIQNDFRTPTGFHTGGSRGRSLCATPSGLAGIGGRHPGCAARPWAPGCNACGVKNRPRCGRFSCVADPRQGGAIRRQSWPRKARWTRAWKKPSASCPA
jgi:hypothetical protein